jgi:hypothetical protein
MEKDLMNTKRQGRIMRIILGGGPDAIVDEQDYDNLVSYQWRAIRGLRTCYAVRNEGEKLIKMHRQILSCCDGLMVDHINHNGLDNRRSNLRICTASQNQQNRQPSNYGKSRYKGVCWHSGKKKWRAAIVLDGRSIHIGYYDYEIDAAVAYDDAAIELFGEFACLNCWYRPEIARWLETSRLFAGV